MSAIAESVTVAVPFENVPSSIRRYLAAFPSNEREGAHYTLRAWAGGIATEHEILLKVVPEPPQPQREILDVRWRSLDAGPYPVFDGTLVASPVDAGSCRLELCGSYAPPGGVAGAAFDALLGRGIAVEGARDLLARFKAGLEAEHARPEVAAGE
jgi:uncharacterized membrane protein